MTSNSYQIEFANQTALKNLDLENNFTQDFTLFSLNHQLEEKNYVILETKISNGNDLKNNRTFHDIKVYCMSNFTHTDSDLYCLTYKTNARISESLFLKELIHDMNNSITELSFGYDLIELKNPDSEIAESITLALKNIQKFTDKLESYYEK